jgi:hypothetical protein
MARRNRDLAGLAALGALGYAMFGGNRNKVRPDGGAPVEDRSTAAQAAAAQAAAADDENYGFEGRRTSLGIAPDRVVASPRMETPSETVARVGADAMSRGRRAASPRRNVAGDYTRKMGATAEELAAYRNRARSVEREPDYVSKRKPNVIYDAQGREVRPLKKGGAVKKMASGGMTSASKRADGIATKGKTKCKMY